MDNIDILHLLVSRTTSIVDPSTLVKPPSRGAFFKAYLLLGSTQSSRPKKSSTVISNNAQISCI